MNMLLIYSTTDGHTKKICDRLVSKITSMGSRVQLKSIDECDHLDLTLFDKIVIGASIRYGKHSDKILSFINTHERILNSKSNAFFSVNVVARKPEKNRPETNPYFKKFIKTISWHPKEVAVFAGKIDYARYSFFDRKMIQLIMWMTKGPTDPKTVIEYTNWQDVENFAQNICQVSHVQNMI